MTNRNSRRLDVGINVAIVVIAVLILAMAYWKFVASRGSHESPTSLVGTAIALNGVEWTKYDLNVVIVLSTNCKYCTDSLPFYRRLLKAVSAGSRVRSLAVFPQTETNPTKYLSENGLNVVEVRRVSLRALGVTGTPTILFVNHGGVIKESWTGKLTTAREEEVIRKLRE